MTYIHKCSTNEAIAIIGDIPGLYRTSKPLQFKTMQLSILTASSVDEAAKGIRLKEYKQARSVKTILELNDALDEFYTQVTDDCVLVISIDNNKKVLNKLKATWVIKGINAIRPSKTFTGDINGLF